MACAVNLIITLIRLWAMLAKKGGYLNNCLALVGTAVRWATIRSTSETHICFEGQPSPVPAYSRVHATLWTCTRLVGIPVRTIRQHVDQDQY